MICIDRWLSLSTFRSRFTNSHFTFLIILLGKKHWSQQIRNTGSSKTLRPQSSFISVQITIKIDRRNVRSNNRPSLSKQWCWSVVSRPHQTYPSSCSLVKQTLILCESIKKILNRVVHIISITYYYFVYFFIKPSTSHVNINHHFLFFIILLFFFFVIYLYR
jgi:hypothetical protein